jgi:hypothetical protein
MLMSKWCKVTAVDRRQQLILSVGVPTQATATATAIAHETMHSGHDTH